MTAFLPILMLDEHRLAPSFGYVFNADWHNPHESIVTLLWKYVRGNAIAGHVVVSDIARKAIDPYGGIEAYREAIDVSRLKSALGLSRSILNEALIPARRRGATDPSFRYCPSCLSRGYHSVVHQFAMVRRCPIHDLRLETACRRCGYSAPYRLTARLLESPFVCPQCHRRYGIWHPNSRHRYLMPMKDLMPIRRMHIAYGRY